MAALLERRELLGEFVMTGKRYELRYPIIEVIMVLCRGEFQACINHLNQALAVQPMVATCWYLRGIAAMQLQVHNNVMSSSTASSLP